jgi:hypothetical protein
MLDVSVRLTSSSIRTAISWLHGIGSGSVTARSPA